jgi:DNA repair protein RadD
MNVPQPHAHQANNIEAIREWFRKGVLAVLWYLPTGGGKSFAAAFMLLKAALAGKRCWFIVHRRELLRQTMRQFKSLGIDFGIIAAGYPTQSWKLVQICSMGTLMRRIDTLEKPSLVVQDECHHLPCKSWSGVLKKLGRCYMVGLSASPTRADGRGLGEYFGAMVVGLSPRELIAQGYLSPFRTFAPPTVDTSGLHIRAGDYKTEESELLMDKPTITGSAVSEYRKLCDGKRAIVFCVSIAHSQHVAAEFRAAGYAAAHIDGKTDDQIRDMAIDDFERGAIQVLCNVDLCGEGLSINAIECVILLRPTQSLGLYIQQVGRGLRTWPGKKELLILDHVGSTQKFGFIDEPRDWALTYDEVSTKQAKKKISVRVCAKCFAASPMRSVMCVECKHPFPVESREVASKEGTLVELTPEELARKRERQAQGMTKSLSYLIAIGRIKKYKDPEAWAMHVWRGREAKKQRKESA